MAEPYVGEIRVFGFNFAPVDWVFCNGALMSIAQNTTLFAVIGTTYGGNGTTTYGIPNMNDRIAVGMGTGAGLPTVVIGQVFGEANHSLLIGEVPQHTHTANAGDGVAFGAQTAAPTATSYFGRERGGAYTTTANTQLAGSAIGQSNGGQPHANNMPTQTLNFCMAQFGVFPSQN